MKVKLISLLLAAMLLVAVTTGCSVRETSSGNPTTAPEATETPAAETPTEHPPESETPPDDIGGQEAEPAIRTDLSIDYSQNFGIVYYDNGAKLITDSDGNKLLLVPKNEIAPSGHDGAVLVETPISGAMYTSTTYVGLLGAMGIDSLYDSVAAVTTEESDWTVPQIRERFQSGVTKYIMHGYSGVGDIDEIISTRPEFVFTGGMDDIEMNLRNLLDEVGIKHATLLEWTEEGDAAYFEWIKFFAAFFNLDEEADGIFKERMAYLNELYTAAANAVDRPTVAYGMVWDGMVYTQSGTSTLAQQIERAGGEYVPKDLEGAGNVTISMEEFLDKCRNADIIIYGSLPQYCPDKAFLLETEPLMEEFDAFKNDKIYIFDQGYYMNSAKVVEKFEDMLFMFQPDMIPGHSLVMYQKLPD